MKMLYAIPILAGGLIAYSVLASAKPPEEVPKFILKAYYAVSDSDKISMVPPVPPIGTEFTAEMYDGIRSSDDIWATPGTQSSSQANLYKLTITKKELIGGFNWTFEGHVTGGAIFKHHVGGVWNFKNMGWNILFDRIAAGPPFEPEITDAVHSGSITDIADYVNDNGVMYFVSYAYGILGLMRAQLFDDYVNFSIIPKEINK